MAMPVDSCPNIHDSSNPDIMIAVATASSLSRIIRTALPLETVIKKF
jgi:hypothetical protein